MAVFKEMPKSRVRDVVITLLSQSPGAVTVQASDPMSGLSWNLGYFKQNPEGELYFERAGGINKSPSYPMVALQGEGISKMLTI